MKLTIDSSVYLSALLPQEPFHAASKQFLNRVRQKKNEVVLPILIPFEICNTLLRQGVSKTAVDEVFQSFFETEGMSVIVLDRDFGATLFQSASSMDLKTSDWIVAATCLHFGARLITWDKQLIQKSSSVLQVETPK